MTFTCEMGCYSVPKLHKGQVLYTRKGEPVEVVDFNEKYLRLSFNKQIFNCHIDILGRKVFYNFADYANPNVGLFDRSESLLPVKSCLQDIGKNRPDKTGNTVTLQDAASQEIVTYTIISSYTDSRPKRMGGAYYGTSYEETFISNAEPEKGIISDTSPIGKAILGHCEGEEISVSLPSGNEKRFLIMEIK